LGRPMPGPGEPLWTDEDRGWALALIVEESEECPGCGHPLEESTDPGNEFAYRAHARQCHVCATRDRAARRTAKGGEQAVDGLLWRVERIDRG